MIFIIPEGINVTYCNIYNIVYNIYKYSTTYIYNAHIYYNIQYLPQQLKKKRPGIGERAMRVYGRIWRRKGKRKIM